MEKEKGTLSRPPIVVVLGHVDHGKTTLLDKIRNTSVQIKEAGGITQKIGASQVLTKDSKKITFIDTPGHAAFAKMRSRGAGVADIAILVVAADDGVKPQTVEALEYIKAVKIPFIVTFTKIDLASANIEKALSQLEKLGVSFEGKGGNTPFVRVSGKTGDGLEDLLEMIILVSEVNEIKANKNSALRAVVIETTKGKAGPLATVVVKDGKLTVGDSIFAEEMECKVKALIDSQGKSVPETFPGDAVQILGFGSLPLVGAIVGKTQAYSAKPDFQEVEKKIAVKKIIGESQIPIVLKADTAGSLEAITASLPQKVMVIESGVGEINESDVLTAKSSGAEILAFNVKTRSGVLKLADTEGVKIESFNIIYKLLERLEERIKGQDEKVSGKALIIATFPFNNKRVAGCKVIEGVINKLDNLKLRREMIDIGSVKIITMKKQKQDIITAKQQEEVGIIFEPQLDFKVGDVLVSVKK